MAMITREITRKDDFSNLECITINLKAKNEKEFYDILSKFNHDDLEECGCPNIQDNFYCDQIAFFEKTNGYTWADIQNESDSLYKYAKAIVKAYNERS